MEKNSIHSPNKKAILISGGSGFLGQALITMLVKKEYLPISLTRGPSQPHLNQYHWNPINHHWDLPPQVEIQGVIHLAGENIASKLWTKNQKQKIKDSRLMGTKFLVNALYNRQQKLDFFISSSAIGYYGNRGNECLNENSSMGLSYLANICNEWESEAQKINLSARNLILRTGLVLDQNGGFIKNTKWLYALGLGAYWGKGEQYISWILLEDWVNAVIFCMENSQMTGNVNLVSPEPVTNKAFLQAYAKALHRPLFLTIPEMFLNCLPGQMAKELFLLSQKVYPEVLANNGFRFQATQIDDAFRYIFNKKIAPSSMH